MVKVPKRVLLCVLSMFERAHVWEFEQFMRRADMMLALTTTPDRGRSWSPPPGHISCPYWDWTELEEVPKMIREVYKIYKIYMLLNLSGPQRYSDLKKDRPWICEGTKYESLDCHILSDQIIVRNLKTSNAPRLAKASLNAPEHWMFASTRSSYNKNKVRKKSCVARAGGQVRVIPWVRKLPSKKLTMLCI